MHAVKHAHIPYVCSKKMELYARFLKLIVISQLFIKKVYMCRKILVLIVLLAYLPGAALARHHYHYYGNHYYNYGPSFGVYRDYYRGYNPYYDDHRYRYYNYGYPYHGYRYYDDSGAAALGLMLGIIGAAAANSGHRHYHHHYHHHHR